MKGRLGGIPRNGWMVAVLVGLLLGSLNPPAGLAAQDTGSIETLSEPGWARAWTPLQWTAELPRVLPDGAVALPDLLLWPAPRAGLFWTAGNPAALPADVEDRFSTFSVGTGGEEGEYRRPLDPEEISRIHGEAMGWRPFGGSGAAIGRVRVRRSEFRGALSDYDLSYPGSPYVVMDTAGSDLGRTEVELEGAGGWELGPVGFGIALGYRAHQTRTLEAPVPRSLSSADPGASVGLTWRASPSLTLGVHGRWRNHAERVTLFTVAASSRVYRLQGYFEPPPQDLGSGGYSRRVEREGYAGGVSAGGTVFGATWAAFAEVGTQDERQLPSSNPNLAADTWASDALTVGASAARALPVRNGQVSLITRMTTLSGDGGRGDLPDTVSFVADERVFQAEGELSLDASETVRLGGRVVLRYEDRDRSDQLARVGSGVESWTTWIGVAALFRPTRRLSVSASVANGWYGAGGPIPDPTQMGRAYRRYIAPELALGASDAAAQVGSVTARWSVSEAVGIWARALMDRFSPSGQVVSLQSLPEGHRNRWSVSTGVSVRRR
ncbi:MAG: hypothetical protein R6T96_07410 [Longimicrobiales bacterium]